MVLLVVSSIYLVPVEGFIARVPCCHQRTLVLQSPADATTVGTEPPL